MSPLPLLCLLLLTLVPSKSGLLTLSIVFPTRVPLRRVHPRHRTLNPLRAWGRPAQPPRLGSLTPGNKTGFVPLSNYMNGSTADLMPRPPAPSSPMEPSLPFSMELDSWKES
uniref:Uncharacterized protein n=1 Tax=Castor canadensis TaxID=51338 RepID=A0A8C0ZZE1_CASCN